MPEIDAAFTDLPLRRLADAALSRAKTLGADHADIRVERIKDSHLSLHDARLDGTRDGEDVGFAVRVLLDGSWGFASHVDLTPESAERVAEQAIEVAKVSRPLSTQRVELADEPAYGDVTWVSPYEVDPFSVPDSDKISLLADWSSGLLAHDIVAHADASVHSVVENKFYSDLAGTTTTQQRVRIQCQLEAAGHRQGVRPVRHHAHAGRAGRSRLGVPHRHRVRLGSRARRAARAPGREAAGAVGRGRRLRPGHRPDQPVPHHPRVDRARHRAGPGARLRGQLRRHVVRDLRPARAR